MVHLAPDSRLLVSLVKQEQAYAAQLHNLLNASGASLSSLSVYASSSPPSVSPVLNGVAGAFSGADEALRTYGEALNDWVDQLGSIKRKEEEVANIGRDREILVTRLLKVSQKSKSPPPSLLHAAPDPSSSSSFPTFNSKITAAQTELQACESQLAEKEHELETVRIHAIRQGLQLRCRALVQCGWVWGEMGRRALAMLDGLGDDPPAPNGHAPEFFKPLPDPLHNHDHDHDSVLSSLSPSQSASQIGHVSFPSAPLPPEKSYQLDIPPPHLLAEHNVIPGSSSYPSARHPEPEAGSSSSEDEGPVEVHENTRFLPAPILNRQSKSTRTAPSSPSRGPSMPLPSLNKGRGASSDIGPSSETAKPKRERDRKRTGLFGSLASLFRTSMTPSKSAPSQQSGQWSSRTDRNLRSAKTDGEQSSDDEEAQPRSGRLRKAKSRAATTDDSKKGWGNSGLVGVGATQLSMPSPPASPTTVKKKKSGGKLARNGTVRSSISEPAPAPRVRANTLTTSSSGPALTQSSAARRHGKTASMDGRWGLSGAGSSSMSSLQTPSPTSTWKSSKQTTGAKGDSLMSIVEGVSRFNQAGWSHAHDDPSSRLELVRAPGSSVPRLPLLVHPPPALPASTSAPSSPTITKAAALKRASMPAPSTSTSTLQVFPATEKKPLRSALRNPSRDRTPSPSPSHSPNVRSVDSEQSSSPSPLSPLSLPGSASPASLASPASPASPTLRPVSMTRPLIPSTIIESPRQSIVDTVAPQGDTRRQSYVSTKTDDSASISSYETGHENFDDEEPEPATPTAPAPPAASEKIAPPSPQGPVFNVHPAPDGPVGIGTADELSSSTSTDTATGITPSRRKSVRMSTLPPQFSATPPALDEYDDVDRSPWGKPKPHAPSREEGWNTRTPANNAGWDDSSSEDEEYKAARRALSRADRRSEKNKR